MTAKLVLTDGTVLKGKSFGADIDTEGEFVFNTSMTGYQEILTDPSYLGQIVVMTYPLIGNYGVNDEDFESEKIHVKGFIVKEYSKIFSNRRATRSLGDFLKEYNIPGVEGIDTRMLTRKIRINGMMNGLIHFGEESDARLIEKAKSVPLIDGQNLAKDVSVKSSKIIKPPDGVPTKYKVVSIDCGIKTNIHRKLAERGCEIESVNWGITKEEIIKMKPDGVFLSNGPGDPEPVDKTITTIKEITGKIPVFGICLGHQILGISLGFKTYKLKFGHRGGNQPVMDLTTGKVEITAQNHSFCIDEKTNPDPNIKITHVNLNDKSVEGLEFKEKKVFSVQYHPEASPGPHDSDYLFDRFINYMDS